MVSGSGRRKSGVLKASELSSVLVWHRPSFTQPTSTLVWTTTRGIRWVQDYREKSSMRTFIEWENVRRVSQLNEPAGETTTSVFDEICLERRKFGAPPSSSCCFCIESFDNPPLYLECSSTEQCNAWFHFCHEKAKAAPVSAPNNENQPPAAKHLAGKGARHFFLRQGNFNSPPIVTSILFVCMVAITALVV